MAEVTRRRPPKAAIVVVLLLLIGGGAWWWWSSTQTGAAAQAATLSGSVEADDYQVAPAISGRVTKVLVAEGDTVKKGDTLVQLDQTLLKLQVGQAGREVHGGGQPAGLGQMQGHLE